MASADEDLWADPRGEYAALVAAGPVFELFGLKQVIDRWRKPTPQAPVFRTPLLYKIVRHPLYLGFLIAFWATPYMTSGQLLFAIGMTAYVFIGASFEEKDLVRLFGERYRRYQQEVSMILPWSKTRKKELHTSEDCSHLSVFL